MESFQDEVPVKEKMPSITRRSISTLIKNRSMGDLDRIFVATRDSSIDFNLASSPADFDAASAEPFLQNLHDVACRTRLPSRKPSIPLAEGAAWKELREGSRAETLQGARWRQGGIAGWLADRKKDNSFNAIHWDNR